jgi:hypothetical protein
LGLGEIRVLAEYRRKRRHGRMDGVKAVETGMGCVMISKLTEPTNLGVSEQEIERRMAQYRREAFQRRAVPHVIYHPPDVECPWPVSSQTLACLGLALCV